MPAFPRIPTKVKGILKRGGIGVLPTDTLYGLVGSALKPAAVERIYVVRRRDFRKPMIVLIGDQRDLKKLGVRPRETVRKLMNKYWPGPVSLILPCPGFKFTYLHRESETLAVRLPADPKLRALLKKIGPLVAPSANLEGKPPALTIAEAKKYFGKHVDFYLDGGRRLSPPSTLIDLTSRSIKILRKGKL